MATRCAQYRIKFIVMCTVNLLLHEVVVDKVGHDGNGDSARTLRKYISHGLVLKSDDILAIYLSQVMV